MRACVLAAVCACSGSKMDSSIGFIKGGRQGQGVACLPAARQRAYAYAHCLFLDGWCTHATMKSKGTVGCVCVLLKMHERLYYPRCVGAGGWPAKV